MSGDSNSVLELLGNNSRGGKSKDRASAARDLPVQMSYKPCRFLVLYQGE